jgi:hypothetical protein
MLPGVDFTELFSKKMQEHGVLQKIRHSISPQSTSKYTAKFGKFMT